MTWPHCAYPMGSRGGFSSGTSGTIAELRRGKEPLDH